MAKSEKETKAERQRAAELAAIWAMTDERQQRNETMRRTVTVRNEIRHMLLEQLEDAIEHKSLGEGPVGKRLVELFLLVDLGDLLRDVADELANVHSAVGSIEIHDVST